MIHFKRIHLTILFTIAYIIVMSSNNVLAINNAVKGENLNKMSKSNSSNKLAFRFIVGADSQGGDHGINSSVVNKIMKQISQLTPKPDFFVIPGDLIDGNKSYSKTKGQLAFLKETLSKYFPIQNFYVGMGNHEASAGMRGEQAVREVFSEFHANFMKGYYGTVYYFDYGDSRFFMLNDDHPGKIGIVPDNQLAWVKAHLKKSSKHNFFFFHQPAFPSGISGLFMDAYQRDKLWKVIDSSNRPMVFSGHEHNYARRHIDSKYNEVVNGKSFKFTKRIYQLTVGGLGGHHYDSYTSKLNVDVAPIAQYHYLVVDVMKDGTVVGTAYKIDGKVIDRFSY